MPIHTVRERAGLDPALIEECAGYLMRACGPDGRFNYRENLDPEVHVTPRYNILRHAGAVYALLMYQRWRPDHDVAGAIVRANRYLTERCLGPMPTELDGEPTMSALWSRPEIVLTKNPLQAKLGAAGLGLIALAGMEAAFSGSIPKRFLNQLAEFILFMQKPDGGFYSKFVPEKGGRDDRWTSLYYPGEAALGLMTLDHLSPDARWRHGALNALLFLARSREGAKKVPADHWALLASARVLALENFAPLDEHREALVVHATQICESMLRDQVWMHEDRLVIGGYTKDGRTCPTSTRLEGLLAALTFLPIEQTELRLRLTASVRAGFSFLIPTVIKSGRHAGGVPRDIHARPAADTNGAAKRNDRSTEIRIDYVQHAMCAMLQGMEMDLGS